MEEMSIDDISDNVLYFANSIDVESYSKTLKLAEQSKNIIPSFGIHPMRAAECNPTAKELSELIGNNHFVGEIGLDFFWVEDEKTYAQQKIQFIRQLEIVKKNNCVASIHTKGAESEVLRLLRLYNIEKSIIHWYSGPVDLIADFLEIGCYFTIGPDILKGSTIYKEIPTNRIFAETDNPTGMPWITGDKAQKDDIKKIYKKLSEKLNISERDLILLIKDNFRGLH